MKTTHIILLVLVAVSIGVLISVLNTAGTYDSMGTAKARPGKFMHVAVRLDKSKPVEYDPIKDANYLSFHAIPVEDPTQSVKVIYRNGQIPNLMMSERLILKGKYDKDHFECKDVQTKCPSKYKEEMKATDKTLQKSVIGNPASTNSEDKKY